VLDGRPPWRAFQNRLLGPLALRAVERATGLSPAAASGAFAGLMILAKNAVAFALLARFTGGPARGLCLTAVGAAAFVACGHPLFYPWDFLDLIIFHAFAYMVFAGRAAGPAFLALFVAALLNRESAAFFGFWLLCLAAARWHLRRCLARRDLALGALLVLAAVVFTKAARDVLFVESPLVGADQPNAALGNHLALGANLAQVLANFASVQVYVNAYLLGIAAQGVALARSGRRSGDPHRLALGLYVLGFLAVVLAFGAVNETRVYLVHLPFVVFSLAAFGPDIRRRLDAIDGRREPKPP
jgi:hypothetical protein